MLLIFYDILPAYACLPFCRAFFTNLTKVTSFFYFWFSCLLTLGKFAKKAGFNIKCDKSFNQNKKEVEQYLS